MARNFDKDEVYKKPFDPHQFRRLLSYLKPYKLWVGATLLLMLVLSMAELAGPILIKLAIDSAIAQKDAHLLQLIGLGYLALRALIIIASYFRTKVMHRTGQSVIYDMREQLFNHIQRLSLRFFDSRPAGKIMVRITNDVENLNSLLTSGLVQVLNDAVTLMLIVGIMLTMHFKLALYTFAIVPLLILIATKLRTHVRENWRNVRRKRSNMNANLQESISGARTIQAFTQEPRSIAKFRSVSQGYTDSWMSAVKVSMLFGPSVEITGAIGSCIVYAVGALFVVNGNITAGTLVAFISYVGRFWEPISRISNFYNQVLVAMASAERVFAIIDEDPEIVETEDAIKLATIEGSVIFDNVSFGYDETTVLHDINIEIKAGQTVALVGATGAGKSSIVNLIPRFYDPDEGRVLIDGIDIKHATVDSLREQIGIVLQDPLIFSGTIKDNIRYGNLSATDDIIEAAAKAVNAHEFIINFEKAYNTEVQERGSKLSVGQRQLISFARAIIANPRILILDEATSSIDTNTELLIQEATTRLLEDRTAFIIAHRLSTIRAADIIIVIDDGRIVETGNHEELMREKGIYFELNKAQFMSFERAGS